LHNLPPLTGAILISNPRKDPIMAGYRRNAGRPRKRTLAQLRKSARPGVRAGSKSAIKELKRRGKSNPRNPQNPRNAINMYIGRQMKAGKSMKQAWEAYRKLKRKPASWTEPSGRKRKKGDHKRRKTRKGALSAWQKYVKAHAGKGRSMSQMADDARKKGIIGKTKAKKKTTAKRKKATNGRRGGNAWTRFLKKHGGKGWSRAKLRREYKKTPAAKKAKTKKGRKIAARKPKAQNGRRSFYAAEKSLAKKAKKTAKKTAATKKRKAAAFRKYYKEQKKAYPSKPAHLIKRDYDAKIWAKGVIGNPFGALALKNGLALDNPTLTFGDILSPAGLWDVVRTDIGPVIAGAAIGGSVHAAASASGITTQLIDGIDSIPVIGEWLGDAELPFFNQSVTQLLPYSIQGSLIFVAAALAAGLAPAGAARSALAWTAGSALTFGGALDAFNFVTGRMAGMSDEDMLVAVEEGDFMDDLNLEDLDMAGLALDNVSALGGLALDNFGDGFAWQTAPLQAMNNVSALGGLALDNDGGDYNQSNFGDAYYSGADFSGEEGQALLNGGRSRFFRRFGRPTYRPKSDPKKASHHAGQPGHRWGWLVRLCGWPKVRELAAMHPKERLKLIRSMRQAAMTAYQQSQLAEQAVAIEAAGTIAPEFAPVTPLAPAAGVVVGGAIAPGGPVGSWGDPALFMS